MSEIDMLRQQLAEVRQALTTAREEMSGAVDKINEIGEKLVQANGLLRKNRRDFEMVKAPMWQGHPFTLAIQEIDAFLAVPASTPAPADEADAIHRLHENSASPPGAREEAREADDYHGQPRIRLDIADGDYDIAVHDVELVHIERMTDNTIWGRLSLRGGGEIELGFWTKKGKVHAKAELLAAHDGVPVPVEGEGGDE